MRRLEFALCSLIVAVGVLLLRPAPVETQQPGVSTIIDYRTVVWNSSTTQRTDATAADGAFGTLNLNTVGAGCAVIWMTPSGTITAGQLAFDVSFNAGLTWTQLSGSNGDFTFTQSDLTPATTAFNGQEAGWRFPVNTFSKIRTRLQASITGSGSVTIYMRSVSTGCTPFTVVRQGDASRLLSSQWLTAESGAAPTITADGSVVSAKGDEYGVGFTRPDHPNRTICFADNLGATLTELTNCALQSGKSFYFSYIIAISTTGTGGTMAIREGTGTNCGTNTIGVIPVLSASRTFTYPANTSAPLVMTFPTPIKALASNAICAIGTATNTLNVMIGGFFAI